MRNSSISSNSDITSSAHIGARNKFNELTGLVKMQIKGIFRPGSSQGILSITDEYARLLQKYDVGPMHGLKALEIGYGARPLLHFALTSMGVDVMGIDLDEPMLSFSPARAIRIFRKSGMERTAKSTIRFFLKDIAERRELAHDLKARGFHLLIKSEKLLVGDATQLDIPNHSLDFIYSEDVFEHISREKLDALSAKMALWLKPSGVALIRPCIFTGISGGHLTEWFGHTIADTKRKRFSEPWEHLRKKRFKANTWLNEMPLAEYRSLFQQHFHILSESETAHVDAHLYMTDDIRQELAAWCDDDLLCNKRLFVLRPL